jgi:hypothetical protein
MISMLIVVFFLILLLYLWPTLIFFATHKRVRVKINNENGSIEDITLFLEDEDPLWKAIQKHKQVL